MSDDDASSPAKLTPPAEDPSQIFPTRGRGGGGGSTSSGRGSGTPPPSPSQPQVAPPPLVEQGIYTFGPGAGSRAQAAQPQAEAAQPVAAQPPQPPKTDPSIYRFGPPSAQAAPHSQVSTPQSVAIEARRPEAAQPQPRSYSGVVTGDTPDLVLSEVQASHANLQGTRVAAMGGQKAFKDHPEQAFAYQLDAPYATHAAVQDNALPVKIKMEALHAKTITALTTPDKNTLLIFRGVTLMPQQKIPRSSSSTSAERGVQPRSRSAAAQTPWCSSEPLRKPPKPSINRRR